MPSFALAPLAHERDGSSFGDLTLENVFIEPAQTGARFRYELRPRAGLTKLADLPFETDGLTEVDVPDVDAPGEISPLPTVRFGDGQDPLTPAAMISAIFAEQGVNNGQLFYFANGRLFIREQSGTTRWADISSGYNFGAPKAGGPKIIACNTSAVCLADFNLYVTDPDTLALTKLIRQVGDGDIQPLWNDVAYLNGRVVAVERNSGRMHWTDPFFLRADQSVAYEFPGLNFLTAEAAGDNLIACEAMNNRIYGFGASTIQMFDNTGSNDAAFAPTPGGVLDMGLLGVSAKTQTAGAIVFATERNERYRVRQVFMVTSGRPAAISSPTVEEDLERLTERQAAALEMWTYGYEGHNFIVLDAYGLWTWVYDTKLSYWVKNVTAGAPWAAYGATVFDGRQVFAARHGAELYTSTPAAFDGTDPVNKRAAVFTGALGRSQSIDTVTLDMAGLEAPADVELEISDDRGETWNAPRRATLPVNPRNWSRPTFRRLGRANPAGFGMRVSWDGPEPRAVAGLHVNEANYG